MWFLRLYISHEDDKSAAALIAVNQFLEKHKHFGIKLQIVDINSQMEMAERDGVKEAPTLIKVDPPPLRELVPKRWDPVAIAAELEA